MTGRQLQRRLDGGWVYPPLEDAMEEAGLQKGGYLSIPPPELSCTAYFYETNYGPVSSSETEAGNKGEKEVLGTERFGFGGDADG